MTYLKFLFMCITLALPQLSNAGEADAASESSEETASENFRSLVPFNTDVYTEQAREFEDASYHDYALMADEERRSGFPFDLTNLHLGSGREAKTEDEIQAEEEAHKAKLDNLVIYERNFSQRGIEFLREDEIVAYRKLRRERIRGPVALLQLAREITEEPRQRNLLEHLMDYDWMRFVEYVPEEPIPGDAAALILRLDLRYWNAQDFRRPETLNFSALFSVLGNMRRCLSPYFTPMDPGDPMFYLDSDARSARQAIITWHVNTASIPGTLRRVRLEDILEEANCLGRSTTYGFFGEYDRTPCLRFDLLYQLIRHGYTGFKEDRPTYQQHIWVLPHLRISVRVKDTGEFTIGFLKETTFSETGEIIKSMLKFKKKSEILKVSGVHLISARRPGYSRPFFTRLWAGHDRTIVDELMDEAHFKIDPSYFDFERAARELKPV